MRSGGDRIGRVNWFAEPGRYNIILCRRLRRYRLQTRIPQFASRLESDFRLIHQQTLAVTNQTRKSTSTVYTMIEKQCQPIHLTITDFHQSIVERIRESLPPGATLLHVSITGSRGKRIAIDHSDYDTKVLLIHSKRDYLLQKQRPSWHFEMDLNGIELEGTVTDYLRMSKYIQESNIQAHETFVGIPILTTPIAIELKSICDQSYDSQKLKGQYTGLLTAICKRKIEIEKRITTSNKLAFEAVYIALKVMFIHSNPEISPPFDAKELIRNSVLDKGTIIWVEQLLADRIANKAGEYEITQKFLELVNGAIDLPKDKQTKSKDRQQTIEEKLESLFLELMG